MNINKLISILIIGVLCCQSVLATTIESARCRAKENDSLDIEQAKLRTQWAYKCYPGIRSLMPKKEVKLKDTATNTVHLGYPIFGQIDENGNLLKYWKAPIDPNASCEPAKTYSLLGFCLAGCYTPDQLILFSDGYQEIAIAKHQKRTDIVTLAPNSTFDNLDYVVNKLHSYTVDRRDQEQEILIIKTEHKGELKVTLGHPLVTSLGSIKEAYKLKVGDKLVSAEGYFDKIISINKVTYFGKVYNVKMENQKVTDNIIVAQGYLNGSVYFQNIDLKEANRQVLRQLVPDAVIQYK